FARERGVGGAEVHRGRLDLGDAAARADGLVVDPVAGGGVVVRRPARHQREHERGAGAGDLRGGGCRLAAGGGVVAGGLARGQAQGGRQGKEGKADGLRFHACSTAWRRRGRLG